LEKSAASLDAVGVVTAIKSGVLSPVTYAEGVAERAEANSHLNALAHFDPDYLITEAARSFENTPNGVLTGLPIVVKDNVNTTTYPTSAGTQALAMHTPVSNAEIVNTLVEQGGRRCESRDA